MTPYSDGDVTASYEFKIIRSATGLFGRPENMRKALDEEAKAGWELVEKFDDNRLRLKRPLASRRDDRLLDFDPYRTWIGVSESGMVLRGLLVSAIVGAVVLVVFLVAFFAR
jgi:hypothetical protein